MPEISSSSAIHFGALGGEARGVRAVLVEVQERLLVVPVLVPAGAEEQPRVGGEGAVLFLPCHQVRDVDQEVRVRGGLGAEVQHHRRADQARGVQLRDVLALAPGDPVDRGVDVRADVLAGVDVVVLPERARLVVGGDLVEMEVDQVGERLGQHQRRGVCRQRSRQVVDLDGTSGQRCKDFSYRTHGNSSVGGVEAARAHREWIHRKLVTVVTVDQFIVNVSVHRDQQKTLLACRISGAWISWRSG